MVNARKRAGRPVQGALFGGQQPIPTPRQPGKKQPATNDMDLVETVIRLASEPGNRRSAVCPSCSDRYAADAFHLIRAGLSGGHKQVPTCVTDRPRVFLTLTPPSFGPVHTRRTTRVGSVIPCGCTERHHPDDPRIGPSDPCPPGITSAVLREATLEAASAASVTISRPDGTPLHAVWGAQRDIRDITRTAANQIEDPSGQISEARLAGYIAKYATKGTGKPATRRPGDASCGGDVARPRPRRRTGSRKSCATWRTAHRSLRDG